MSDPKTGCSQQVRAYGYDNKPCIRCTSDNFCNKSDRCSPYLQCTGYKECIDSKFRVPTPAIECGTEGNPALKYRCCGSGTPDCNGLCYGATGGCAADIGCFGAVLGKHGQCCCGQCQEKTLLEHCSQYFWLYPCKQMSLTYASTKSQHSQCILILTRPSSSSLKPINLINIIFNPLRLFPIALVHHAPQGRGSLVVAFALVHHRCEIKNKKIDHWSKFDVLIFFLENI